MSIPDRNADDPVQGAAPDEDYFRRLDLMTPAARNSYYIQNPQKAVRRCRTYYRVFYNRLERPWNSLPVGWAVLFYPNKDGKEPYLVAKGLHQLPEALQASKRHEIGISR